MNSSTHLSPHFTLAEATTTSTGLPNLTSPEERARIEHTAHCMETVRMLLDNKPIKINSWFRSDKVNKAVGGVSTSEHRLGTAVDFTCASYGSPLEVCQSLARWANVLQYNQLIYEGTWVHISFPPEGDVGRKENLTMKNGKYSQGINP